MAKFRVDVDGKDVARRIQDRIEDGVDNAADEINDQMRQVAKGKIRDENAVFTRELLEGFTDAKTTFGRSTIASLRNLSFHAPYQEKGVSGTQKQRNTPYKYKDKKPPIDALIPWILANLYGAYWPEDSLGPPPSGYYGSDVSDASRSSGTSGSGGSNTVADENGIPVDDNRLYVGEPGYSIQGINEEFDVPDLFPNQRIVVFNTNEKEYLRGTVRRFGDNDQTVEFELDEVDGTLFDIPNSQQADWRLAGTEDWDELTESDQKDRLAQYFDDYISTAHRNHLTTQQQNQLNLKNPGSTAVTSARDFWTGDEIFSLYKDSSIVREQVRNFESIYSYSDNFLSKPENSRIGGGVGSFDSSTRFTGVFLSDSQFNRISDWDTDARSLILAHEQKHSLSAILRLNTVEKGEYDYKKTLLKSDWTAGGYNNQARPDIPGSVKELLFHETDGHVLGGSGWLKDAYYAADNGVSGIQNYTPNFKTGKDEPYKRLHEAANHVLWLQQVAGSQKAKTRNSLSWTSGSLFFVRGTYSTKNAAETLATLEEQMWGEYDDWEENLENINQMYPWFIEAWLEGHNPPQKVKDKLEYLGWTL